jgi:hypothetical protein
VTRATNATPACCPVLVVCIWLKCRFAGDFACDRGVKAA